MVIFGQEGKMQVFSPKLKEAVKKLGEADVRWSSARIQELAVAAGLDYEVLCRDARGHEIRGVREGTFIVTWRAMVNGSQVTYSPNDPILEGGQHQRWDITSKGRDALLLIMEAAALAPVIKDLPESTIVLPSDLPEWLGWAHFGAVPANPNTYLCLSSEVNALVGPLLWQLRSLMVFEGTPEVVAVA